MTAFTKSTPFENRGIAYLYSKKEIIDEIDNDSLYLKKHKIIVDPSFCRGIGQFLINSHAKLKLTYTCGFVNILSLDYMPIIKVGNSFFVVARLEYKSEMVTIPNLEEYIQYRHSDEVEIFRELLKIYNLDDFILSKRWKTKAQLKDFWYDKE